MQSITLQGRFGVYYRLYLQPSRVASLRVKPVLFNDIAYTCQFIRSLNALPSYWQQLATHLGVPASQRANTHQLEHVIAKRLIAGHLHLYALTATPSHSAPKSQRLLKDKHNKEIEITLPQQLLNEGRVPNQAFTNASDAFAFISELNPSNEQLRVLAASLDITAPPNQHQAKIAQKIAAGDACIVVTQANNNTLIEHVDAQAPAPQPKPRTLGPQAQAQTTQANTTAANDDENQTSAMTNAAEEGTPFCEECEQEEADTQKQQKQANDQSKDTEPYSGHSEAEQQDQKTAMSMAAEQESPFCEDCAADG